MENAELIKALRCKEYFDLCKDASCKYHVNGMRSGCRCEIKVKEHAAADALEAADNRVKELKAAQRWISVKERLPAVSEYRNGDKFKSMDSNELVPFLVCCEDTEIPFRAFYDGKNWGDGWGKQNVTHWQKLPQPPEKGE